jgi:hypothetical protein
VRITVTKFCRCVCCNGSLEPAQQLRFLVETATLDDPAHLSRIRVLPSVNGRPVPVCKACHSHLEANPSLLKARVKAAPMSLTTGLLGALGALSLGVFLGSLFAPRG